MHQMFLALFLFSRSQCEALRRESEALCAELARGEEVVAMRQRLLAQLLPAVQSGGALSGGAQRAGAQRTGAQSAGDGGRPGGGRARRHWPHPPSSLAAVVTWRDTEPSRDKRLINFRGSRAAAAHHMYHRLLELGGTCA